MISADSLVRCRPSPRICPLCRFMASVLATAWLCLSNRISLNISVSLFVCSALIWGGYTGGSWTTIRLAPAAVSICDTSLSCALTTCLGVPFLMSLVPHRNTIVDPSRFSLLSSAHSLASWSVAVHILFTSWFVHVIRCPCMSQQFESPSSMIGGLCVSGDSLSSCSLASSSFSLLWSLVSSLVFSWATCSSVCFWFLAVLPVPAFWWFCWPRWSWFLGFCFPGWVLCFLSLGF